MLKYKLVKSACHHCEVRTARNTRAKTKVRLVIFKMFNLIHNFSLMSNVEICSKSLLNIGTRAKLLHSHSKPFIYISNYHKIYLITERTTSLTFTPLAYISPHTYTSVGPKALLGSPQANKNTAPTFRKSETR